MCVCVSLPRCHTSGHCNALPAFPAHWFPTSLKLPAVITVRETLAVGWPYIPVSHSFFIAIHPKAVVAAGLLVGMSSQGNTHHNQIITVSTHTLSSIVLWTHVLLQANTEVQTEN